MIKFRQWLLLLGVLSALQSHAQSPARQVQDSLARLYVSATPAGPHFIVDQGRYKAIFNAQGRALTPFMYNEIRPGLGGRFLARIDYQVTLIDSAGGELALLAGALNQIDPVHRFYRTRDQSTIRFYEPDGRLSASIPFNYSSDPSGTYVWTLDYSAQQGVIDTLNRTVLPRAYQSVQIGDAGIAAMKGDSVYVFDLEGRLRFRTIAHESKMLAGGAVGVKLYGLWGIFDSAGRLRQPLASQSLDSKGRGKQVELDGRLLNLAGGEVLPDRISNVDNEPGGWYSLRYEDERGEELRDADFRVVLPRGSYNRLEYAGDRFIFVFADYNDPKPRIYDRGKRRFTDLPVERHIHGDAYLLYDAKTHSRQVLNGDSILRLPQFTALEPVKGQPYFRITRQDSGALRYRQKPDRSSRNATELFLNVRNTEGPSYGLLDSGMRLIVPLEAAEIFMLAPGLIYAPFNGARSGAIYRGNGSVLLRVPAGNTLSMVQDLIRISGPGGYTLVDTLGRTLYRGGESPAVLVSDPQAAPERKAEPLPVVADGDLTAGFLGPDPMLRDIMQEPLSALHPQLLLYDDSSGYSGLYDIYGQQLLPHAYYPVAQRIPGLHALKKGDSVYFVNAHGRLLYGGRGFRGRNYHILESYALLLRDGRGRWGSIDASGKTQLPFVYDSVYAIAQSNGIMQYMLAQAGRYAILNRNGDLLYPPQPWKPDHWIARDHVYGTDNQHHRIIGGQAVPVPGDSVWGIDGRDQDRSSRYFRIETQLSGRRGGIYSSGGNFLTSWYPSFDYRQHRGRMVITDSARTRIAVIDTSGRQLLPFMPNPPALIVTDSAIVVVDTGARDRLYYTDGRRQRQVTIRVDSALRARLLSDRYGSRPRISNAELMPFRTAGGSWGVMNYNGRVLIDPKIDEILTGDYIWRIRRSGRWGLFMPAELRYAYPPEADSIAQDREEHLYTIRQGGLMGLYRPPTGLLIPPVHLQIFQPHTVERGYFVTRVPEGYAILNLKGERIAPVLDSVNANAPTIPTMAAFLNGAEVSLAIGTDGRIVAEHGMDAKIRRAGIAGTFARVVVLRDNGKFGLYSNEQFRMILPARYDAIDANAHGFIAWKYRPDKHQGMDSTLLLDVQGRVIRAMQGGYNPQQAQGFWYLRGAGYAPVLNTSGTAEIIPDGYSVTRAEQGRYFIVEKDQKLGIMSDTGTWLTPLSFDKILIERHSGFTRRIGRIEGKTGVRFALIDRYGRQVTAAVYDDMRFDDEQILFRRGTAKGYLDEQGKEHLRPLPKDASGDD